MATPTSEPEAFLTTEEVLGYLQVNLRTVYRLIDAGKLPAVRVALAIAERRAKMHGLDAPSEVVVHSPTVADIDAWVANGLLPV